MKPFVELIAESNQIEVSFLVTELQTALTFLGVAATSRSKEVRARNVANARKAYQTAIQRAPEVALDAEQRQRFERLVEEVRTALERTADGPGQSEGSVQRG